jgi:hypothetical protein
VLAHDEAFDDELVRLGQEGVDALGPIDDDDNDGRSSDRLMMQAVDLYTRTPTGRGARCAIRRAMGGTGGTALLSRCSVC